MDPMDFKTNNTSMDYKTNNTSMDYKTNNTSLDYKTNNTSMEQARYIADRAPKKKGTFHRIVAH